MIQTRGTDLWERDPVRTEVETFLALKRLENDPSVTYLALPWAPWINGSARIPKLEQLKGKAFTVCQHIRFREITRMLADAGVETLFTPHATRSEPYINGVRILGLPHFPVAFKEQEPDPDILFSFLGAPTARVRRDIVAKFGGPHVAMRDRWHFEIPSEQRVKEKGEYADVMSRSRFALCPKGTGPSSLRIWEAIAARVIPVVLADDLRLPIGIDWESCSIQIEEDRVDDIPPMLAGISAEKYAELRKTSGVHDCERETSHRATPAPQTRLPGVGGGRKHASFLPARQAVREHRA